LPIHLKAKAAVVDSVGHGNILVIRLADVIRHIAGPDREASCRERASVSPARFLLQLRLGVLQESAVTQAAPVTLAIAGLFDDVLREYVTYGFRFTVRLECSATREDRPPCVIECGDQDAHVIGVKDPARILVDGL
jgi:hypothetical protein